MKKYYNYLKSILLLMKNFSISSLKIYKKYINEYLNKIESNKNNESIVTYDNLINKPLVSIITPVFNSGKFLEFLAYSLKTQTLRDKIQWIIVDDCSTDDTEKFINKIINEYKNFLSIKILKNLKNGGASFSLVKGFHQADGDILGWVSSDDFYVDEYKIEKDLLLLDKKFDLVFSKSNLIGESPSKSRKIETNILSDGFKLFFGITIMNIFNGSSVIMKRDIYKLIGGFDDFLWNIDADYDLFSRMILIGAKIGISDSTVFNKTHKGQTSSQRIKMAFGTSISRSRFLKIDTIRNMFYNEIYKNKKVISKLALCYPLFFLDLFYDDYLLLKIFNDLKFEYDIFLEILKKSKPFLDFINLLESKIDIKSV